MADDRPDLTDEQNAARRDFLDNLRGDFDENGEIDNSDVLDVLGIDGEGESRLKVADRLLVLIEPQIIEVFEDQYNNPYVVAKINGQVQAIPIAVTHHNNGLLKKWISKIYYDSTGSLMTNSDAVNAVCNHFSHKACFGNNKKNLDLRTSYGPNVDADSKTIYYDLTNKLGEVVVITKDGWSVKKSTDVPIMFERRQIQIGQVYPTPAGQQSYPDDILDQFMNLFNVRNEDKLLLMCYIISLFIPKISKPIFMLHGPEGAAKSACQKLIKSLVDPTSTRLLKLTRREDDLVLQLAHNYLIYYDNVSEISSWISDLFCMVSTGTSFSKRMLYTDDQEVTFEITRPIGFNGINLAANKADILDRGLNIELEGIEENRIKVFEREIIPEFERLKPYILSYIFDIISKVLDFEYETEGKGLELRSRSRMADWEEYGEIIARCMGFESFKFLDAYRANREKKTEVIMEESPVAQAIVKLMAEDKLNEVANGNGLGSWSKGFNQELIWTGSSSQLYTALKPIASNDLNIDVRQNELWPKAPNILSRRVARVSNSLKKLGIYINRSHNGTTRSVEIVKVSLEPLVSLVSSDIGKNYAHIASDSTNDIPNDTNDIQKIPLVADDENHPQKPAPNDTNDTNGICTTPTENIDPDLSKVGERLNNLRQAVDSRDRAWKSKASEAAEANLSGDGVMDYH